MKQEKTNCIPRSITRAETNGQSSLKTYDRPRFVVKSIAADVVMASSFDEKNGEYILEDVKW